MKDGSLRELTVTKHWFRFWMPYQFIPLKSERFKHVYLPLNRDYKPLGYTSNVWVNYADYIRQAVVFKSDPHKLAGIWTDPERLYMYTDSVKSRKDYFARLELLMSRKLLLVEFAEK